MSRHLSGWVRLWLVTFLIGSGCAICFAILTKDLSDNGEPSWTCVVGTSETDFRQAFRYVTNPDYTDPPLTLDQWVDRYGSGSSVVGVTMSMKRFEGQSLRLIKSYYSVPTYRCTSWQKLLEYIGLAFAFSSLLVGLGLVTTWVLKGFRQ